MGGRGHLAEALRERGWRVHWLGAPGSMESRLVPPRGFPLEAIDFGGVRGKGPLTLALLPLRLLRAFWQSLQVVRRVQPDVVVGLGGYISFPGGMMGVLLGKPLVLHEQNSVAGLANTVLAGVADRVFSAFPGVMPKAEWIGNPLRAEFLNLPTPEQRFAGRSGPLKVLVVGGSLGARALNTVVPQALALIPEGQRPIVTHQAGEKQIDELRANYAAAGVQAHLTPFIDNTALAFADADLVICRAGASTVTELAAVGAASMLVPFPHAVDDHQTHNAQYLAREGAAFLMPQATTGAAQLAERLNEVLMQPEKLNVMAGTARRLAKPAATSTVVDICLEVAHG